MTGVRDDAEALRQRATVARERSLELRDESLAIHDVSSEALETMSRELAQAREKIRNLELALQTNRRIGMAIGIVMARLRVQEEEAFDVLRRASQQDHRKLREVAEEIVYTGKLPGAA
jgi:AmiR/NasT family two-component response regulator